MPICNISESFMRRSQLSQALFTRPETTASTSYRKSQRFYEHRRRMITVWPADGRRDWFPVDGTCRLPVSRFILDINRGRWCFRESKDECGLLWHQKIILCRRCWWNGLDRIVLLYSFVPRWIEWIWGRVEYNEVSVCGKMLVFLVLKRIFGFFHNRSRFLCIT